MRTVAEHRAAALALVAPLGPVEVDLDEAPGHVLADAVAAGAPSPPWDNSAMDGYAVRAADVAAADATCPVLLRVVADLPAGTAEVPVVGPGTAARIMTGAPFPDGADAVVPVEQTDGGIDVVAVRGSVEPGRHVRRAGEDVAAGTPVLVPGVVLAERHVAAAAAAGVAVVRVRRRPRVAVLSTGSELAVAGAPLRRGLIHDSNSHLLAAAAAGAGCAVVRVGAVPDDPARLRDLLAAQDGAVDAVITSGGVSVGAYDVVKAALQDWGDVAFDRVAMQPGKPQGLGRLPDGTPAFCLPGNPVSALVSFEVFVRPALLRMRGLRDVDRPMVRATVLQGWRTPEGRAQYMPVSLDPGGTGVRPAVPGGSGSHLVTGLARADGLAVVPAEVSDVRVGETVDVMRLEP